MIPPKGNESPSSQGAQVAVEGVLLEIHEDEEGGWLSEQQCGLEQ